MGLLRKRVEIFFVILCSGGGHLPPAPSSYALDSVQCICIAYSEVRITEISQQLSKVDQSD